MMAAALETHRPPMSSITLRFLAEPSTVNFGGKVHGGTVMKWIDEAGYACATRWAKRYCVTVYVGGIRFHRPIMIGDLVEVGNRSNERRVAVVACARRLDRPDTVHGAPMGDRGRERPDPASLRLVARRQLPQLDHHLGESRVWSLRL